MESLCLAYHHLGKVKMKLGMYSSAYDYLQISAKLADRFLTDEEVRRIIYDDLARVERILIADSARPRSGLISHPSDMITERRLPRLSKKQLLNELIDDVHKTYSTKKTPSTRASSLRTLPSPKGILSSPDILMFSSSRSKNRRREEASPNAQIIPEKNETPVVLNIARISDVVIQPVNNEPNQEEQENAKKIILAQELNRIREIQNYSAIVIQKHVRGWITRSFLQRLKEAPATPSEVTYIIHASESENISLDNILTLASENTPITITDTQISHIRSQTQPQASLNRFISKRISDTSIQDEQYDIASDFMLKHNFSKEASPAQIRKRAKLGDYLDLERPVIRTESKLDGIVYEWEMRVVNIKIEDNLQFDIEFIGNTENSANTLYYKIHNQFEPRSIHDYRVMHPFEYNTIWPVAISAIEELQDNLVGYEEESDIKETSSLVLAHHLKLLDTKDEESYDPISIQKAKKCFQRILSKIHVKRTMLGSRISTEAESFAISIESSFSEEEPLYYIFKDGVISKLTVLQKHELYNLGSSVESSRELLLNGTILEKGIVEINSEFMFMSLNISTDFQAAASKGVIVRTDYDSFARFELHGLRSNWKAELSISWEKLVKFFKSLGENLHVPYLFYAKSLPSNLREPFYNNIGTVISIENSTPRWVLVNLIKNLKSPDTLLSMNFFSQQPLIQTSHSQPKLYTGLDQLSLYPHYTESSKSPSINLASYIHPKDPLVHFNHITLKNFQEPLRLSVFLPNINTLKLRATTAFSQTLCLRTITDSYNIQRIVRICDQDLKLAQCIIVNYLLGYKTILGVSLESKFTSEGKRLVLNDILHFDGSLNIITVYSDSKFPDFNIRLYNTATSRVLFLEISQADILHRNLAHDSSDITTSMQDWLHRAGELLDIHRGLQGRVLGIKNLCIKSASKKNNDKRYNSPSHSSLYSSDKDAGIFRTKTVLERKISLLLNEPELKLMDSYTQTSIITQRCKNVQGTLMHISVIRHGILEEWRLKVHIPNISKTFICKVYDSDLWNITENALNLLYPDDRHIVNTTTQDKKAWEMILNECKIELRSDNEMMFSFDNISIPLKELIYSSHFKKQNELVYAEVYIKTDSDCMSPYKTLTSIEQAREFKLIFRTFLYEKRIWLKTAISVEECILHLLKEGILDESILTSLHLTFFEIQSYAGALCRILKMKSLKSSKSFQALPHIVEYEEEDSLDIFTHHISPRAYNTDTSSILEKDELLYSEVHSFYPPITVGVYFNSHLDEFLFKIYKPDIGKLFRQPLSKKSVLKDIPLSDELLKDRHFHALGIRVLSRYISRVLENLV